MQKKPYIQPQATEFGPAFRLMEETIPSSRTQGDKGEIQYSKERDEFVEESDPWTEGLW